MSWRKPLFWIHLVIGCLAGIVVLIMSVTGVLLTYEKQTISWIDGSMQSTGPRLPVEEILEKAGAQNHSMPSGIALHADSLAPAEVSFGRKTFLVDAHTGGSVENWHRWLAMSGDNRSTGRALTGAANLGFLILVLSGPILWMPRRWTKQALRAVSWFRGGLSGRARDFNWHNVIGIWTTFPLFLIVISGLVMSYPWANNLLYTLTGSEVPAPQRPRQPPPRGDNPSEPTLQGLNASWTKAEQQVPDWRTISVRLPPGGVLGPVTFSIDTATSGIRPDLRSQLTVNSKTAEVIRWEQFSSYNQGRKLRSWFRFIHTGEAAGVGGQTIAGLASAGAVVLVWTGLVLAIRRFLRSRERSRAKANAPVEAVTA
jgi:uncharacterized iron-regulated membrane protein